MPHAYTAACRCPLCAEDRIHAHLSQDERSAARNREELPRKGPSPRPSRRRPKSHVTFAQARVSFEERYRLTPPAPGRSPADVEAEVHAQCDRERVAALIDRYELGWQDMTPAERVSVLRAIEAICDRHGGREQLDIGLDLGEAFRKLCAGRASWLDVSMRALGLAINNGFVPR